MSSIYIYIYISHSIGHRRISLSLSLSLFRLESTNFLGFTHSFIPFPLPIIHSSNFLLLTSSLLLSYITPSSRFLRSPPSSLPSYSSPAHRIDHRIHSHYIHPSSTAAPLQLPALSRCSMTAPDQIPGEDFECVMIMIIE